MVTCTKCGENVVWTDDIAAMRDGVCGDCQDGTPVGEVRNPDWCGHGVRVVSERYCRIYHGAWPRMRH